MNTFSGFAIHRDLDLGGRVQGLGGREPQVRDSSVGVFGPPARDTAAWGNAASVVRPRQLRLSEALSAAPVVLHELGDLGLDWKS